jgi:serine/threonine-protein kinase
LRRVIGEVVGGRYSLEERLGSGGSSSVWRARDQRSGRDVAVKLLHLDAAESAETVARFDREARVLEGIASPNTVELLDRGDMDGRPYLVFELIDGTDLRERLRQDGMIDVADAVAIATQVANGLAAAHSRRCVHRDLKPGNILISDDGRVCVADFGIARALEEPGLTQPGRVLGTGEYVSPEQALGRKVDARSDLYALGVVLYEMLAGRPPFRGSGFADVAARHVRDEPPPIGDARPNLPAGLSALIAALLAKAPEERPQDAATVRAGLRQILKPLAGTNPSPIVATALSETDDVEPATGEYDVLEHGPSHLGELAPWEDVTPSSMNFDHGGPIHLESAPYRVPASARENAGPLRWAAVIALGFAVGVIALLLALTGGGGSDPKTAAATTAVPGTTATAETTTGAASGTTSTEPAASPLLVQTALTFDPPPGDGSENDDQAQQAIDGDAATFWETEIYRSDPVLSKGGVGLVLAFAQREQVAAIDLRTPGPGFTAAVYTSTLAAPPDALAGWDVAASPRDVSKTRQRIQFDKPARARFVLVWISRLAPAEGSGFSARIAEAQPLGS